MTEPSKIQQAADWLQADKTRTQGEAAALFRVRQPNISRELARRKATRLSSTEQARVADAVWRERQECAAVCCALAVKLPSQIAKEALSVAEMRIKARSHTL